MGGSRGLSALGGVARMTAGILMTACIVAAAENADTAKERPQLTTGGHVALDSALGFADGELKKLQFETVAKLGLVLPEKTTVDAVLRVRADPVFDFGRIGSGSFPELSDYTSPWRIGDRVEVELREVYLRTPFGDGSLTVGKQQIVWGVADGLKVLDVVNPMDLREFILDDFEDSRIPLWSVNAQVPVKDWELQLLWLPDPSYHIVPRPGSDYEVRAGLPEVPPGFATRLLDPKKPNNSLTDADAGFRLSGFKGGWDLTFNYLYHYDDVPALNRTFGITRDGPTVLVTPEYLRGHILGGTAGKVLGGAALRTEYAFLLNRPYSTDALTDRDGVVRADEFSYVVGVDWFAWGGAFLSVQLFQNWLLTEPKGIVRDRLETYGTFLVQRRWRQDRLLLQVFWIESLDSIEGLVRPKISYEVNDHLSIFGGVDVFYGDGDALFGQYDRNDRITFGMQWSF